MELIVWFCMGILFTVGVQAFAVALLVGVHRRYGTLDVATLSRHLESDINAAAELPSAVSQEAPGLSPDRSGNEAHP